MQIDFSANATVTGNQPVPHVWATLKPLDSTTPGTVSPTTGILLIVALIDGVETEADVYIDDQLVGKATYQNADMPAQTYQLEVRVRGDKRYYPYTDTIVVTGNDTTRVNAILKPRFGSLVVTGEPSGVSVDVFDLSGVRKGGGGANPNFEISQLASGTYHLAISKDRYYHTKTRTVTIRDGEITRESVKLAEAFGKLILTSDPSDAEVFLGGKSIGVTPFTENRMLSGSYTLTLRSRDDLYLDKRVNVEIRDGKTVQRQISLPANFGILEVDYKPAGVKVFLNDQLQGKTPIPDLRLKPSVYNVRVEVDERYRTESIQVIITNGQTQLISGELIRKTGGVKVLSTPHSAEISLEMQGGKAQQMGLTPKALTNLQADDYTLRIRKKGYKEHTQPPRNRSQLVQCGCLRTMDGQAAPYRSGMGEGSSGWIGGQKVSVGR